MGKDDIYGKVWLGVMCSKSLDSYAKTVYGYLCARGGQDGKSWPSLSTICEDVGIARATAAKATKALQEAGEVAIKKEAGKGNVYYITRTNRPNDLPKPKATSSPDELLPVHEMNYTSSRDELLPVHEVNSNKRQYKKRKEEAMIFYSCKGKEFSQVRNHLAAVLPRYRSSFETNPRYQSIKPLFAAGAKDLRQKALAAFVDTQIKQETEWPTERKFVDHFVNYTNWWINKPQ
jgi:DNA-binding transcriptional regulator YhcF (GntR family)